MHNVVRGRCGSWHDQRRVALEVVAPPVDPRLETGSDTEGAGATRVCHQPAGPR
jgi:hypothetical protein